MLNQSPEEINFLIEKAPAIPISVSKNILRGSLWENAWKGCDFPTILMEEPSEG